MNLTFYKCDSDPRKLVKTMTDSKAVTGVFAYDSISMLSPTFVLDYDSDLLSRNYFYCEDFDRWYFVSSINLQSAGKIIVSGSVDVLQTYKEEILKITGNAVRSTSAGFTMIPDTAYPITPGKENVTSLFIPGSDLVPPEILPPNQYRFVLTLKK